jgi:hypothetical protein
MNREPSRFEAGRAFSRGENVAVYQLIFREPWPLGQEIRRPGEIVLEGECRIPNATPEKIAKAITFGAVEIREVPCEPSVDTGKRRKRK